MKRLFAIALLLAGAAARAQSDVPQVTAHIQPDSVMIGDRFDLVVDVEKDLVQVVQFPEFEDKPGSPIELHKEYPIDTLERDGRHLKLRKRYTLAAFEEGKWNLGHPAVLYADKNIVDTLWARDSLYLQVATFQIDSTSQSIYDVKPQWNLPFRFGEVSGYAKWGALALVLLLTNDGDLASKLTHPKYLKKKIYHVYLDKNLTKADMDQIAAGIQLEDGEIHADAISYSDEVKRDQVGIEIHSGKNRIVRRIFESLGYKVVKLDRVFFAGLTKKGLRRGEWRYLTEQEVNFLRMGSFE